MRDGRSGSFSSWRLNNARANLATGGAPFSPAAQTLFRAGESCNNKPTVGENFRLLSIRAVPLEWRACSQRRKSRTDCVRRMPSRAEGAHGGACEHFVSSYNVQRLSELPAAPARVGPHQPIPSPRRLLMIGPKTRAVVKEADARLVALVLRLLSRQGSFGGVEAA